MNDAIDALAEWKDGTITRGGLLRRLLEYENWMMPMREDSGVDPFGPFALPLAELVPDAHGEMRLLLFADGDVMEAFAETYKATGGIGFANPTGMDVFCVALDGVSAVVMDPGSPHEFVIPAAEFPEVAELAEATAVERAWRRLRKGDEEEGDVPRVARYPGYYLAAVQSAEGAALIHVPHDDGGMFVPVFTHADALALALDEIHANFPPAEVKTVKVSGERAFPAIAKEVAAGIVFNYKGPGEPMAFRLDVTDLMLAELAKTPPPTAPPPTAAAASPPPPVPGSPPPLPAAPSVPSGPPPLPTATATAAGGPPPLPATVPTQGPPPLPEVAGSPGAPMPEAFVVQGVVSLSNEGVELMQTQRTDEAQSLLRRALALAEEKLGTEHPSTATCLSNLGECLSQSGRFDEAEQVLRRAVDAVEDIHGVDAAETGTALNNLALVLRRTDRLQEAEPLYRAVLAIFEKAYGPDSMKVAGALNNLSQILQHTGRSEEAEPLMRRVIGLFENHFGADHPNVAIALNNLARLLESTGRAAEAEPLSRRHLRIFQSFEDSTGNEHAYKESATNGYGSLLKILGLSDAAIRARIDTILAGRNVDDLSSTRDDSAAAPADFDRLSQAANAPDAGIEDNNKLFAAAFKLAEWYFIARGELPDVHPYIAANPTIVDGAPMVKAFTDTTRLHAFAKECGLTGPNGDVQILSLPVASILPTLESYAAQGVTHIHFNADASSHGFYVPLVQLPIIRRHLEKERLL